MISTSLFTQIGLDSGALTQLGSVVHPVPEPGEYRGVVLVDEQQVADFAFVVAKQGRPQLDVDVAALVGPADDDCGCGPRADDGPLAAGGHLLLHVGSGRAAYAVVVSAVTANGRSQVVLDTRELAKGDLFAATVLRPGRYRVANTVTGAEAKLDVAYPELGRRPMLPGEPVRVTVGERFEPDDISVRASQGQVYAVESGARIVIELVEPYDRKPRGDGPRHRWLRRPAGR